MLSITFEMVRPHCLRVFLVNNKRLILVITSRIKPEILGHVVHFCFSNIHQVHRLFYEQDGNVWRLSTEKGFQTQSKDIKLKIVET